MWNHTTLYLSPDVSADEAKVIIEMAEHITGDGEVPVERRDGLPNQAVLLTTDGRSIIWDRKFPDDIISCEWSLTDEKQHYNVVARIIKRY
jgi:hypothetical protein